MVILLIMVFSAKLLPSLKSTAFFCLLIFLFLLFPFSTFAQTSQDTSSLGIANDLSIRNSNVESGDIISFSNNGYILSKIAYDPLVVGVVTKNPAIAIVGNNQNTYPVVSTGNAYVNVSGMGGAIKPGDLITTSTIPGIGQKANHSGYVIGSSEDSFSPKSSSDIGQVNVSLNIHYFSNRVTVSSSLLDVLSLTSTATYEDPATVFKYFVAGVVVVISVVFGFIFFGRTANRGIEALGRNPLAGKIIQLGIFLNVLITIAIIAGGLVVAYFILRL